MNSSVLSFNVSTLNAIEKSVHFKHSLVLQSIIFLIPVNIYLIGEGVAAGIQWILFRYQYSEVGTSFIVFYKDVFYIQEGYLNGKSALAGEFAILASILMIVASIILLIAWQDRSGLLVRLSALLTICCGVLFLLSDMIQYGFLLNVPAGFVIPVGMLPIVIIGILIYRMEIPS